jgi:Eco57I restriction-modification methylase
MPVPVRANGVTSMSIAKYHAEWHSLLEIWGPFLSLPVLVRRFPQGLDAHDADHFRLLRQVHDEWDEDQNSTIPNPGIHTQWIKWVLKNTLEFDKVLIEDQDIPQTLKAEIEEPQNRETLRPDMVLMEPEGKKARLLIQTYPLSQRLGRVVEGKAWKASPDTRMTQLLRDTDVSLGLVTNGDQWMLVYAPKGETSGYTSWYSTLWLEEQKTLSAFRTLLGMHRFFGVSDVETLDALLAESAGDQQEVTDQLGYQVRRAVEVLVQSLDKADQDYGGKLLRDVPETLLYEASLNVMMRLVFLFCAEERDLLLLGDELYDLNFAVSTLREQLRATADNHGEEVLERRHDAWNRLLTTFRAVHGGVQHQHMKLLAYGGRLFDPDRFPFLEGRQPKTKWRETQSQPLPINNRTVLHLLEALQVLQVRLPGGGPAEPRKLSFRALGIEQIGHVYEGLLDHTAIRATEPILGLSGTRNHEPEIPLSTLEKHAEKSEPELHTYIKKATGRSSVATIKRMCNTNVGDQSINRFRTVCHGDEELWKRVKPYAGLVRDDSFGCPSIITAGSVYVTSGTDRRSSGTHYTPKSLTEPIVKYTLEPLVYEGPAEGKPKSAWKLKPALEIIDLKVCDIACGSGAFLVQTCRYLSDRLVEAWEATEKLIGGSPRITPLGEVSEAGFIEQIIPMDTEERLVYARRIVAQRCLYGVDVNPLAVEMAKLSLWLLTLAKGKPFEILDHAIRCGDSLVGIHDIGQLKYYSLKPDSSNLPLFKGPLDRAVEEANTLRLKLEDMPAHTIGDVEAQEKLLEEAEDKIVRLRCAADLLVAGVFWGENVTCKLEKVRHATEVSAHYVEKGPTDKFVEIAAKKRRGQKMFHWPLEFPEVILKRGGFDAIVGNPPFLWALRIAIRVSIPFSHFLKHHWPHAQKNADLCSYFFLQSHLLVRNTGNVGFIATNTISEADTKETSLMYLVNHGCSIYRASPNVQWPGSAAVRAAIVYLHKGQWKGSFRIDNTEVKLISPSLDSLEFSGSPEECVFLTV